MLKKKHLTQSIICCALLVGSLSSCSSIIPGTEQSEYRYNEKTELIVKPFYTDSSTERYITLIYHFSDSKTKKQPKDETEKALTVTAAVTLAAPLILKAADSIYDQGVKYVEKEAELYTADYKASTQVNDFYQISKKADWAEDISPTDMAYWMNSLPEGAFTPDAIVKKMGVNNSFSSPELKRIKSLYNQLLLTIPPKTTWEWKIKVIEYEISKKTEFNFTRKSTHSVNETCGSRSQPNIEIVGLIKRTQNGGVY